MSSWDDYYKYVKEKDFKLEAGGTYIQWKGTDVCMDIYCPNCKAHSHMDVEFLYEFKCEYCGKVYAMGTTVQMTEVPEEFLDQCENAKSDPHLSINNADPAKKLPGFTPDPD